MRIKDLIETYQGKINWVEPNANFEYHEVINQLTYHKESPFLPDWVYARLQELSNKKEWIKSVKSGKPRSYSRNDVKNTNNTGDAWSSIENDAKKKRAPTLYGKGKQVERPIILRNPSTGERHLIAGHHRVTYVTDVLKQPVEVHEIT